MWRRRQDERQANNVSCLSYINIVEIKNGNSAVRNYPTQIWSKGDEWELWLCLVAERSQMCNGKPKSPLPKIQGEAVVSCALYGAIKWLILRWKIGTKKINSFSSKHKLNNFNLLYLLWHWRDGNWLFRCWLWMYSPLLFLLLSFKSSTISSCPLIHWKPN